MSFAERAATGLEGGDLLAWLARVDAEVDNLRAALDWSTESAGRGRGVRLVRLLALYLFARSDLAIGRVRLEATLEDPRRDEVDRAGALGTLCIVCYRAGAMVKAARYGDEAVAIGRRIGDSATLGRALHWRGWARFWGESELRGGWTDFEEAEATLRQTDDRLFQALNLAVLAWSYVDTTEALRARALLDEGLALTEIVNVPHARCYCLLVRGALDMREGRIDAANAALDEALELANAIGDHYAELFARGFRAYADLFGGRYTEGRDLCERGLAGRTRPSQPHGRGVHADDARTPRVRGRRARRRGR